jgi:hypothetical protein
MYVENMRKYCNNEETRARDFDGFTRYTSLSTRVFLIILKCDIFSLSSVYAYAYEFTPRYRLNC